jgi:hypothetical protein
VFKKIIVYLLKIIYGMKKAKILTFMVALAALTTGSCKKTYECHCEGPGGAHEHFDIKAKNKGTAESECKKKQTGSFTKCEIE